MMGEKEPLENTSRTHGICESCRDAVDEETDPPGSVTTTE